MPKKLKNIIFMENNQTKEDFGFLTFSGHLIDLAHGPTLEQVNIEDIAHHQAHQCRFGGACKHHYSIAEHSLYVAALCPQKMFSIYFLLHDGHETWYQDLTSPLKRLIRKASPVYDNLLKQCDKTVFRALGLSYEKFLNLHEDIDQIDKYVYTLEKRRLFGSPMSLGLPGNHPLAKAPFGMTPDEAEKTFLETYEQLIK